MQILFKKEGSFEVTKAPGCISDVSIALSGDQTCQLDMAQSIAVQFRVKTVECIIHLVFHKFGCVFYFIHLVSAPEAQKSEPKHLGLWPLL